MSSDHWKSNSWLDYTKWIEHRAQRSWYGAGDTQKPQLSTWMRQSDKRSQPQAPRVFVLQASDWTERKHWLHLQWTYSAEGTRGCVFSISSQGSVPWLLQPTRSRAHRGLLSFEGTGEHWRRMRPRQSQWGLVTYKLNKSSYCHLFQNKASAELFLTTWQDVLQRKAVMIRNLWMSVNKNNNLIWDQHFASGLF